MCERTGGKAFQIKENGKQGGDIKGYGCNDIKFVAAKSSNGLKKEKCLLYLEC